MKPSSDPILRLRFDDRRPFGSPQHYFHYVWGYLLPALDLILEDTASHPGRSYALDSCGPVMDQRSREVAGWLEPGVRVQISDGSRAGRAGTTELRVPRWDEWLRGRTSIRIRLAARLHRLGRRHPVLEGIERVREFVFSLEPPGDPISSSASRPGSDWLLLKRADEPDFYRPGGPADKPTYGVTRRSIANLEELAVGLERRGMPIRIYEPGRDDLATQIRTYHAAAGVIGIRGAELANIVWMRPGRGVVMLVTPVRRENNVARHLALVRGLPMEQIFVGADHPVVDADAVLRAVEDASRRGSAA